jgi:DNA invertase Pin-like site-specific DNA recombinase
VLEDVLRSGDTLVVWKLDRLARSLRKLISTAEELETRGVGLVSLTESIDTTTPGGVLVFHVFGAIAQFERALIRERTTAGLQEARRKGRKGGRPPAFNEADILAARALMKDANLSAQAVAKRMGVSVATLYRHLGKNRDDQEALANGGAEHG